MNQEEKVKMIKILPVNICAACLNDDEIEIPEDGRAKFYLCEVHLYRRHEIDTEIQCAQEKISQNLFNSAKDTTINLKTRSGKNIGQVK